MVLVWTLIDLTLTRDHSAALKVRSSVCFSSQWSWGKVWSAMSVLLLQLPASCHTNTGKHEIDNRFGVKSAKPLYKRRPQAEKRTSVKAGPLICAWRPWRILILSWRRRWNLFHVYWSRRNISVPRRNNTALFPGSLLGSRVVARRSADSALSNAQQRFLHKPEGLLELNHTGFFNTVVLLRKKKKSGSQGIPQILVCCSVILLTSNTRPEYFLREI